MNSWGDKIVGSKFGKDIADGAEGADGCSDEENGGEIEDKIGVGDEFKYGIDDVVGDEVDGRFVVVVVVVRFEVVGFFEVVVVGVSVVVE